MALWQFGLSLVCTSLKPSTSPCAQCRDNLDFFLHKSRCIFLLEQVVISNYEICGIWQRTRCTLQRSHLFLPWSVADQPEPQVSTPVALDHPNSLAPARKGHLNHWKIVTNISSVLEGVLGEFKRCHSVVVSYNVSMVFLGVGNSLNWPLRWFSLRVKMFVCYLSVCLSVSSWKHLFPGYWRLLGQQLIDNIACIDVFLLFEWF